MKVYVLDGSDPSRRQAAARWFPSTLYQDRGADFIARLTELQEEIMGDLPGAAPSDVLWVLRDGDMPLGVPTKT